MANSAKKNKNKRGRDSISPKFSTTKKTKVAESNDCGDKTNDSRLSDTDQGCTLNETPRRQDICTPVNHIFNNDDHNLEREYGEKESIACPSPTSHHNS